MKKYIIHNNEISLNLNIEIDYFRESINCSSILDISDPNFQAFELDILETCQIHDFELVDEECSPFPGSVSHYYTYIKTNEDGTKLRVCLRIRISDHVIEDDPSRKIPSYNKRDTQYVKNTAKEYAQKHFNQPRGYRTRRINIVFNDQNYTSYESALQAIEAKLDEFDPE